MMKPSEKLYRHLDEVRDVIKRHKALSGIHDVKIVGSVAKGYDTEDSDIDFLISSTEKTGLFALARFERELQEILGCKIDIIPIETIPEPIRERFIKEAITL